MRRSRRRRRGGRRVHTLHKGTLRNEVEGSWYMGGNIPGKPKEPLNYAGGIPQYMKRLKDAVEDDFDGFSLQ